jgi:hypothetical protein
MEILTDVFGDFCLWWKLDIEESAINSLPQSPLQKSRLILIVFNTCATVISTEALHQMVRGEAEKSVFNRFLDSPLARSK